jgi:hypothetical protein
MSVTDNQLPEIHPFIKPLYEDLLARLGLTQERIAEYSELNTELTNSVKQLLADLLSTKADITANASAIAANASAITTTIATVTANTSAINANTNAISSNATATTSNTAAISKSKLDITANAAAIAQTASDLTKAKADVTSQAATLTQHTTALAQQSTTLVQHTSTLTQHSTDIGNRLRKDVADTTPYTLGVAQAVNLTDAVRKIDLVGGLLRPYRSFKAIGATATNAQVKPGQDATITPLIDGQVWAITAMRLKTVTLPGVSTVITVKSNSTTIYTQTLLLSALPAVGKVLDLLSIGTTLPADVALPALITVAASSGTFDLLLDGVLI